MMTIDLVFWGAGNPPAWELGAVYHLPPTPHAFHEWVKSHLEQSADKAWLFWDGTGGDLDAARITAALEQPGHLWHASLRFGMNQVTFALDFVQPTWMLNAYLDPARAATSWRLSLRAALIPVEVFTHLGNFSPAFATVEGMALEFGYRGIKHGAIIRYTPELLLPAAQPVASDRLPLADEARLLAGHFGRFWLVWALLRIWMTGFAGFGAVWQAWQSARVMPSLHPGRRYPAPLPTPNPLDAQARVSVLIPTIDRYPYLYVLLEQFQQQIIPPHEIIVVDQTEADKRDSQIAAKFPHLPLKTFYMDTAGQCRSRNLGLNHVTGDYVLFLDDDVEVPPDLIGRHLFILRHYRADVSSGVVYEPGQSQSEVERNRVSVSDVFPTNNTMIRREVLDASGGFDMAYDRRARADGDLAMRVYLSGHLMLLDERQAILHHHAPRGGLRTHKARVSTRLDSRRSLFKRNLLVASEVYLAQRYFTPQQVDEYLTIRVFATLSGLSGFWKLVKAMVGLVQMPNTLRHLRRQRQIASQMHTEFPKIPPIADPRGHQH